MKKITLKEYEKAIEVMKNIDSGTYYFDLGKTPDGKTIALVLGYELGYDEGEAYQVKEGTKVYTLCGKIAVNIDDLQCDYDFDWYMPIICDGDKLNGDIFDTGMALTENHKRDLEWFMYNAKQIIEDFKLGVLTI